MALPPPFPLSRERGPLPPPACTAVRRAGHLAVTASPAAAWRPRSSPCCREKRWRSWGAGSFAQPGGAEGAASVYNQGRSVGWTDRPPECEGDGIMATVPVKQTPDAPATETVEERFRRLEATWMAEVGHHSSTTKLVNHRAFQEIIRLGHAVVPFMSRIWRRGRACGSGRCRRLPERTPCLCPTGKTSPK